PLALGPLPGEWISYGLLNYLLVEIPQNAEIAVRLAPLLVAVPPQPLRPEFVPRTRHIERPHRLKPTCLVGQIPQPNQRIKHGRGGLGLDATLTKCVLAVPALSHRSATRHVELDDALVRMLGGTQETLHELA